MRFLFFILLISFTSLSFSQSTPSTSGFQCSVTGFGGGGTTGIGDTAATAAGEACANFQNFQSNITSTTLIGNFCEAVYGSTPVQHGVTCSAVAVCLTGNGYITADINGFCPDPPHEDGDDDDGDGNDCDAGEESLIDCNDGDSDDVDSDGDGVPDSQDDDDGICNEFNLNDADCDGQCDPQDSENSIDCEAGACEEGDLNLLGVFDVTNSFNIPREVCGANNCLHEWPSDPLDCTPSTGNHISCQFVQTGDSCDSCTEPSCSTSDCPVGQSRNSTTLDCEDIPDFCDIDDDNDGIPDNEGSFACDEDGACDPLTEDCDTIDRVTTYACDEQPPVCPSDASAVDCAILQQGYNLRCSAVIEQSDICDVQFNCSLADPALCAIAHTNYLSYCRNRVTDEDAAEVDRLLNPTDALTRNVDSGDIYFGVIPSEGSEINLDEIDLSNDSFQFTGTIDGDYSATTQFGEATTDVNPFLSLLDVLKALVLLSAGVYSLRTINRAHSS